MSKYFSKKSFVKSIVSSALFFTLSTTALADNIIDNKYLDNNNNNIRLTLVRAGDGKNNVIQGIALDLNNQWLYTLHDTGKPEQGTINRFDYKNKGFINAKDYQLPSPLIGHQGFSVNPNNVKLFSSVGQGVDNSGWYILKFSFSPNLQPDNTTMIKVFGQGYSKKTNTMPTFTPDGRYLIVRGSTNKHNVVRIFDLKKTNINTSDISDKFIVEWQVDDDVTKNKFNFQAITTDGRHVYILSGGKNELPKRLYIYDLRGNLIQKNDNVTLGWSAAAASGEEQHWEPEGMSFDSSTNQLLIGFAIGDKKARQAIIFSLPVKL